MYLRFGWRYTNTGELVYVPAEQVQVMFEEELEVKALNDSLKVGVVSDNESYVIFQSPQSKVNNNG